MTEREALDRSHTKLAHAHARIGQYRSLDRASNAYTGERSGHLEGDDAALLAASLGALLKALRADRRMSAYMLARRSAVSRSTITRLEAGLRRPRRSLLANLAYGLEPDCPKPYEDALAAAAGPFLAEESKWSQRMHRRRLYDAMAAGTSPLPEFVAYPLRHNRAANSAWREAMLMCTGDWLENAAKLDRIGALLQASREPWEGAGPSMSFRFGKYEVRTEPPNVAGLS